MCLTTVSCTVLCYITSCATDCTILWHTIVLYIARGFMKAVWGSTDVWRNVMASSVTQYNIPSSLPRILSGNLWLCSVNLVCIRCLDVYGYPRMNRLDSKVYSSKPILVSMWHPDRNSPIPYICAHNYVVHCIMYCIVLSVLFHSAISWTDSHQT